MTQVEYTILGEGKTVRDTIEPIAEGSLEDRQAPPTPEPEQPSPDVDKDSRWNHHGEDGRVDMGRIGELLEELDESGLTEPLKDAARTHLLSHQRAVAAFESRRKVKR